jgi:hypothetical protein
MAFIDFLFFLLVVLPPIGIANWKYFRLWVTDACLGRRRRRRRQGYGDMLIWILALMRSHQSPVGAARQGRFAALALTSTASCDKTRLIVRNNLHNVVTERDGRQPAGHTPQFPRKNAVVSMPHFKILLMLQPNFRVRKDDVGGAAPALADRALE